MEGVAKGRHVPFKPFCNAKTQRNPLGKPAFGATGKTMRATVIKPVAYYSIWWWFPENYLKGRGKQLGILCSLEVFSQPQRTLCIRWGKQASGGTWKIMCATQYSLTFIHPFGAIFAKNCLEGHWKPLGLLYYLEEFHHPRKPCIPRGKQAFGGTGKSMRATLINPVVYCSFW